MIKSLSHRSLWSRLVLYLFLIIPALVGGLFFAQRSLIYHPQHYPAGFERSLPPQLMQLEYRTAEGRQLAFYLPARSGETPPRRVWVTFSGNASVALDWLDLAQRSPRDNEAFLLIDYPGYGRCEGKPSINATRASADAAISTLAERLQISRDEVGSRLNVVGLSLGAAAALDLAVRYPVQRVVLLAPFSSLRDEAAALFSRPVSWLLRENYDNRARLAELTQRPSPPRVAIFHGTADTLVPLRMGAELAAIAPQVTQFSPIQGATHDTVFGAAADEIIVWMSKSYE